ncbi:MAG: phage tail protein [Firmicutes bacterium]|nr:phage tail protein [Bacillota bacterium]
MAGTLTKDTKLYYKDDNTFKVLANLQEVPEMGGDVDKVEVTTLADSVKKYINGLKDLGDLQFKFLYDADTSGSAFKVLKGLEDDNTLTEFKVEYPDGTSCTFSAYVSVKVDSASVGAVMTFTVSFALQTQLTWAVSP